MIVRGTMLDRIIAGDMPDGWVDAGLAALDEWIAIHEALANDGQNVLTELFRDHQETGFGYWEHFPADDAHDPRSGARFYYHAHDPSEWSRQEHGHFHLFLPSENEAGFSHVVAISMSPEGLPQRLFTTNEWVTGERLAPAAELLDRLPEGFEINRARPSWLVGRWLTALVALVMPQVESLLRARDEVLTGSEGALPSPTVVDDRSRHVLSESELDMQEVTAAWGRYAAELGQA
ncbi:DUF6969 family protein [Guyparkeria sp.]|uniref:DUF6969 family protein n=1 Tax=Guyparkeria sp. TaxID=2035736 RepID=UPI003970711D